MNENEKREIIDGNNDYLKMLEAIAALTKGCVGIGEINERNDVSILAQPQLNMVYNEIATAVRFLEGIDWTTLENKEEDGKKEVLENV